MAKIEPTDGEVVELNLTRIKIFFLLLRNYFKYVLKEERWCYLLMSFNIIT